MKIFCIGLSRTATSSLINALRILKIPSLHNFHGGDSSYISYLENMVLNGNKNIDLDKYTPNCIGFGDLPFNLWYKELDKKYPDAKFILTVRDIQGWLISTNNWFKTMGVSHFSMDISDDYTPRMKISITDLLRYLTYGSVRYDKELYAKAYIKHNTKVRDYFKDKKERFLEMNICDGIDDWEILCDFLGRKVPKDPFPHINKWNKKKKII